MTLSDHQFQGIHEKLKAGGFTVNPRTGADVTSGISVAPMDNERKVPVTESSPGVIKDYAESASNQARFERGRATMLGGWRHEGLGIDFLDTPTVHPHTPGGGGEARARRQMILSDQVAGFDLDTFTEKHNPFHPQGRIDMGLEPHELAGPPREDAEGNPMPIAERRRRAEFAYKQPEVQAWINSPRRGREWQGG